jgi:hypothetical protein
MNTARAIMASANKWKSCGPNGTVKRTKFRFMKSNNKNGCPFIFMKGPTIKNARRKILTMVLAL